MNSLTFTPLPRLVPALALSALLAACGGGGDDAGTPAGTGFAGGSVTLDFAAQAGSTPVSCATTSIAGLGSTSANGRLQDLRFYVSNVRFVRADGSEQAMTLNVVTDDLWHARVGSDSVSLIDLEDASGACNTGSGTAGTNARLTGSVPAGNYTSVRFTLGVPPSLNHLDPTDSATPFALSSTALGWNWTTGRIFAKIELTDPLRATTPTWTAPVFTAHLGAGNCSGNPSAGTVSCLNSNRATVTLGNNVTPFNPTNQKVVLDVAALLAGNNVTANGGGASGCMASVTDPECPAMFAALGINLATGDVVSGGSMQTVFRAAAR